MNSLDFPEDAAENLSQAVTQMTSPLRNRNIVICCDGTSNDVASDSTNVLRLFRSLERSERQIAFYDSGVGTLADPTKITGFGKYCSRMLDQGIGHGVRENVCTAYRFLARTYLPGDRIFLFGFSRGAYTVRALAGKIHFLGLVRPELEHLDRLAWAVHADDYDRLADKRFRYGNRFKSSFSLDEKTRIKFIGAWDTVSSFGSPWTPRTVPNSANNPSVDHIRHAVAIDENRAVFQPNLFFPKTPDQHVTFKQIWFAGSHSDVGGGFPEEENGLSKYSLEWMYVEAEKCGCLFDQSRKDQFLGRSPAHKDISQADPLAVAHTQIEGVLYNAMEFLPRRLWNHDSSRLKWSLPNLYRRRSIPENSIFHTSVEAKLRLDSTYRPGNLPTSYSFGE
ncbi:MAG: DUF2235 domain-containing protein [Schlesneria sp.]